MFLSRVIRIKREVTHSGGETGRGGAPHHSASVFSAPRFPSTQMIGGGARREEESDPMQALAVVLDVGLEPTHRGLNPQTMR